MNDLWKSACSQDKGAAGEACADDIGVTAILEVELAAELVGREGIIADENVRFCEGREFLLRFSRISG